MKNQLFYSILRYKHGLVLGESLNAGILFFDPQNQQFFFEKGDLNRVTAAYPELHINFLKTYIGVLEQNIKKVRSGCIYQANPSTLEGFISKELLFSDAAGLTFDSIQEIPLSEKSNFERTKEYLKQLFLVGLVPGFPELKKRNEGYIIKEVYRILNRRDRDFESKIERNRTVKTALIDFTFDFYWRSADGHFAKAISLDLVQPALIQNKALQLYGALEQFKVLDSFSNEFSIIDILVSKPQIQSNFKEFDKAVQIIDSADTPHKIHLEESWKSYAEELVDSAEQLVQSESPK